MDLARAEIPLAASNQAVAEVRRSQVTRGDPTPESIRTPTPAPQDAPPAAGAERAQVATMQALVTGLRGDFVEMGMVPPPKQFAGISVISSAEIVRTTQGDEQNATGTKFGALERMQVLMVKNILSRLARQESAHALPAMQPEEVAHLDMAV
jgi:hypothetical protein